MNAYECLVDEACGDGIETFERYFRSEKIKGLYCDGNIAINKKLTIKEKTCIIAEEIGHDKTSYGNILNLSDTANCKQEHQARMWGYDKLIGLNGLIRAYEHGCRDEYEIADFLEVPHEYLVEAIEHYKRKYGIYTSVDNYLIYFIPNLIIGKLFKK